MSDLVAERGYERTTVELVIVRAGVSRRTFYELHGGREQWFVIVCEAIAERLLARIRAACESGADPTERASRAAGALVDFCLDDAAAARACFVETLAASDAARTWRDALVDRVTMAIAGDDGDELAARAAVGAVLELAGRRPERLDRDHAAGLVSTMLVAGERGAAVT